MTVHEEEIDLHEFYREMEAKHRATIKDSGQRTEFSSGAVRDRRKGKGRCDLLPLSDVGVLLGDDLFLEHLGNFCDRCFDEGIDLMADRWWEGHDRDCAIHDGTWCAYRYRDLAEAFCEAAGTHLCEAESMAYLPPYLLELSKHFEGGAEKYGDNNWKRGIPVGCYIDSAVRHHLKHLSDYTDEPHRLAQGWNVLCAMWEWAERTGVREV